MIVRRDCIFIFVFPRHWSEF